MKRRAGNALLKQLKDVDTNTQNVKVNYQKVQDSEIPDKFKQKTSTLKDKLKEQMQAAFSKSSGTADQKTGVKDNRQSNLKGDKKNVEKEQHAKLSYDKWQEMYKEYKSRGRKKYKNQQEFERKLRQTIRPVFRKKASNRIYQNVQRNVTKNLSTFEKATALTSYEEMQHEIELEQAER